MAEAPVVVDAARCSGCGKCLGRCSFGALGLVPAPGANGRNAVAKVSVDACRACMACVGACPSGAIRAANTSFEPPPAPAGCSDIWVFSEQHSGVISDVAYELLGKGRDLRSQRGGGCRLCALLLGSGITSAMTDSLVSAGADVVYVVDHVHLAEFDAEVYADAVAQLISRRRPEVVLAGSTAVGRAFLARVAARVGTGLTADCTGLEIVRSRDARGEEKAFLRQTRPAFGGNVMATVMTPNHRPQMATVRPMVFRQSLSRDVRSEGSVVVERLDLRSPRTASSPTGESFEHVDFSSARVVVSGGRGLKSAEAFRQLGELADILEGELAGSRAAVDAGWIPQSRQIGQTGRSIAPKLYLCFGISGAVQHLEGIRGAGRIVAVNNDPEAPIFSVADVGVIGDALEIIPALIAEYKRRRGSNGD